MIFAREHKAALERLSKRIEEVKLELHNAEQARDYRRADDLQKELKEWSYLAGYVRCP